MKVRTLHIDKIVRAKSRFPDKYNAEIKFPLHSSKPGKLRDSIFLMETHTKKNKREKIKILWVSKNGHNWSRILRVFWEIEPSTLRR